MIALDESVPHEVTPHFLRTDLINHESSPSRVESRGARRIGGRGHLDHCRREVTLRAICNEPHGCGALGWSELGLQLIIDDPQAVYLQKSVLQFALAFEDELTGGGVNSGVEGTEICVLSVLVFMGLLEVVGFRVLGRQLAEELLFIQRLEL